MHETNRTRLVRRAGFISSIEAAVWVEGLLGSQIGCLFPPPSVCLGTNGVSCLPDGPPARPGGILGRIGDRGGRFCRGFLDLVRCVGKRLLHVLGHVLPGPLQLILQGLHLVPQLAGGLLFHLARFDNRRGQHADAEDNGTSHQRAALGLLEDCVRHARHGVESAVGGIADRLPGVRCATHYLKRPGSRDCSGYWVTASTAVVV